MKPLLSICIPTYNRAHWLRSSLYNWLPQVNNADGLVELIVSDNASEDHTPQIIEEAKAWGQFIYHRHDQNVPMVKNIYTTVSVAEGEFVWVLGDDDMPRDGAIKRVLEVLKNYSELDYIYANYFSANLKEFKNRIIKPDDLERLKMHQYSRDFTDKPVSDLLGIITLSSDCFCALYCSILRRKLAILAFNAGKEPENTFSCLEDTFPHAVFIVSNLLHKPAYYIGYPCIVAGESPHWTQSMALIYLEILPSLYDYFEKKGVPASILDPHRRKLLHIIINSGWVSFYGMNKFHKRNKFSFLRFIKRFYKFKEFWLLLIPMPIFKFLKAFRDRVKLMLDKKH